MSNKPRRQGRERRIRVRGVRRNPPDIKKLAHAVLEMAMAQAETDAMVDEERRKATDRLPREAPKEDRKSA